MYSKRESALLLKSFWTAFGQYMSLHQSSEGDKVSWVNYKTGERHIFFRLNADNLSASISIEMTHPDPAEQKVFFERFVELKKIFRETMGEEWTWQLHGHYENGKLLSYIRQDLKAVNVFRKEDWPAIISFFKPRLLALDAFWNSVRHNFEFLR